MCPPGEKVSGARSKSGTAPRWERKAGPSSHHLNVQALQVGIGYHGAGLIDALWMQPGGSLIEITTTLPNSTQQWRSNADTLRTRYPHITWANMVIAWAELGAKLGKGKCIAAYVQPSCRLSRQSFAGDDLDHQVKYTPGVVLPSSSILELASMAREALG